MDSSRTFFRVALRVDIPPGPFSEELFSDATNSELNWEIFPSHRRRRRCTLLARRWTWRSSIHVTGCLPDRFASHHHSRLLCFYRSLPRRLPLWDRTRSFESSPNLKRRDMQDDQHVPLIRRSSASAEELVERRHAAQGNSTTRAQASLHQQTTSDTGRGATP